MLLKRDPGSKLKDWVTQGLITPEQAERIRTYEDSRPESSWVMISMLILGVVIIGIGVISVIAANWDAIPGGAKLVVDFLLLALVAAAAVWAREKNRLIAFESILLGFGILCLATIGLIAQVFHTDGKLYEALLFWSAITAGAMLAARHVFVPFVWAGVFQGSLLAFLFESPATRHYFEDRPLAILFALPLLCATLTTLAKTLTGEGATTRAFRFWIIFTGLGSIWALEAIHDVAEAHPLPWSYYLPSYGLALLVAIPLALGKEYRSIQKPLLLSLLGMYVISFQLPQFGDVPNLVYAVTTILTLSIFAIYLASLRMRRLFQLVLSVIGIRFLGLYFQALGGLATTGIGLILSGGVVIGMAMAWNKYRKAIAAWAERFAQ